MSGTPSLPTRPIPTRRMVEATARAASEEVGFAIELDYSAKAGGYLILPFDNPLRNIGQRRDGQQVIEFLASFVENQERRITEFDARVALPELQEEHARVKAERDRYRQTLEELIVSIAAPTGRLRMRFPGGTDTSDDLEQIRSAIKTARAALTASTTGVEDHG